MRSEIIRCDTCTKEHNAEYVLPEPWVEIAKRDGFGNDESMHFCSKNCLVEWATKGEVSLVVSLENWPKSEIDHIYECVGSLSISLDLLNPREALDGWGGTMAQMAILENVREDYKKLCTAINAVLRKEIHHG